MRICIFGSEIGWVKKGVFVGGATVSAVRLGKTLHTFGDEIFVFSSAPRGRPSRTYSFGWGEIINKHIPAQYMSFPYLFLYGLVSFFSLLHLCKQKKIDVISSHSGNAILYVVPWIVGKLLKIPIVHTQYCEINSKNFGFNFLRQVSNKCIFVPDKFVAISKNVYNSLLDSGVPINKIRFIPPIVDSSSEVVSSKFSYRDKFGFNCDDVLLLFIGNLKVNKGIDILVNTFINLADSFPHLKLIVTTELTHKNMILRKNNLQALLRKHDLAKRVIWMGFVDYVLNLIRNVDVLVVPFLDLNGISDYPLVILEAMSVGTPVIATSVGGTKEVVSEQTGILVPPGDVKALSKGIVKILNNLDSYKSEKRTRFFSKCFNPDLIGQQYHSLFLHEVGKLD